MVCPEGRDGKGQAEALLNLGKVGWQRHAFHMNGEICCLRAKRLHGCRETFCQQIAEAVTLPNELHKFDDEIRIAEAKVETAGYISSDQSALIAFDGKRYEAPSLDRVKTVSVAQLIGLGAVSYTH